MPHQMRCSNHRKELPATNQGPDYIRLVLPSLHCAIVNLFSFSFSLFRNMSCVKQVPQAFVLMSRNNKSDYDAVLQQIESFVDAAPLQLVPDFKSSMWQALDLRERPFFSVTQLQGCLFHFTQCIWRKIQDIGMRQDYIQDDGTRLVITLHNISLRITNYQF